MMFQRFQLSAFAILLGSLLATGLFWQVEAKNAPGKLLGTLNFNDANWRTKSEVLKSGSLDSKSTLLQITTDPTGKFKKKVLKATYPKGSSSPNSSRTYGTPMGGGMFTADFNLTPRSALGLDYYVYFPPGFEFNKGGKLPGLYGGSTSEASGGRRSETSFSTRLMWRAGGAGELYAYFPGPDVAKYGKSSGDFGVSVARGSFKFTPGKWHHIRQVVKFQKGGLRGDVQVWIDNMNKPVINLSNVQLGSDQPLSINGLFFSTFFGGSDASWGSPKSQHALFSEFEIWQPQ